MLYIANAFSAQMLKRNSAKVTFTEASLDELKEFLEQREFTSIVGHGSTANLLSKLLDQDIQFNRIPITLGQNDILILAQYKGERLEEGATELPKGAKFIFSYVTVVYPNG